MSNYMEMSTHTSAARKAIVLRTSGLEKNQFGCKFYIGENSLGIEWYEGKSESYADDAAENYVLGIKKYPV